MKVINTTAILGIFALMVHQHYNLIVAAAIMNPSDELLLSEVVPTAQNSGMNFIILTVVLTVVTGLVLNIKQKHFTT